MKRNKLQKTVFSVICIVLAVIMMLSLVITVLPAHAVDETDLERLAEKRAQLEEQLMEQEQVIQGLTENQTLIVFRKAALDKQISLNRETIALIEEQIAVYQELIDRKEEELAAATAAETEQTALLRERIRSMEENDSYSYLAFIFEANSVPEILSRIADVNDIMHYDRELEKSLQQSREDVETIKREYEEAKAEQDAVNEELIARRDQLSAQVTAACELIANLDELSQNAQAEYDAIALAEDEAMQELLKAMQEYAAQLAVQRTSYSGSTGGGSTPSGTASSGAGTSGTGGANGNTSNASGTYNGTFIWPVDSTYITSPYCRSFHKPQGDRYRRKVRRSDLCRCRRAGRFRDLQQRSRLLCQHRARRGDRDAVFPYDELHRAAGRACQAGPDHRLCRRERHCHRQPLGLCRH